MTEVLAILAALAAAGGAFFWALTTGRKQGRKDAELEDMEHAEDLRRRATDDADKLLRDHDDSGWRD